MEDKEFWNNFLKVYLNTVLEKRGWSAVLVWEAMNKDWENHKLIIDKQKLINSILFELKDDIIKKTTSLEGEKKVISFDGLEDINKIKKNYLMKF